MALMVGSARVDEKGRYSGGRAGDQTGNEVSEQSYYTHKKGWYVLRPKDANVARQLAKEMQAACANQHIGYSQSTRYMVVTEVKKVGHLASISTNVNADCSSLVRSCIYAATGKDVGDFATSNEASVLEASGLFEKRQSVSSANSLYDGDVLVTKTKGHTVIVTSGRSRVATQPKVTPTPAPAPKTTAPSGNSLIKAGQQHGINFTGHSITVDGIAGAQTNRMKVRVLQRAMNLDYRAGLTVDGDFGTKSRNALGKHSVRRGEKQYMVTALEILLYLNGYDSHGVECPGIFGNGLEAAVKQYQKDHRLTVDGIAGAGTFKSLIGA